MLFHHFIVQHHITTPHISLIFTTFTYSMIKISCNQIIYQYLILIKNYNLGKQTKSLSMNQPSTKRSINQLKLWNYRPKWGLTYWSQTSMNIVVEFFAYQHCTPSPTIHRKKCLKSGHYLAIPLQNRTTNP